MNAVELSDAARPGRRKHRSSNAGLRRRILDAACAEFAAKGFDGASTRAIAHRAGAHQPQINYFFESKEGLWQSVVNDIMSDLEAAGSHIDSGADLREIMVEVIRVLVRFAATRPELHQILLQEGTHESDRLRWIVQHHAGPRHEQIVALWRGLQDARQVPPVPATAIHHMLVGAATLAYANAPEAELLIGQDPRSDGLVESHIQAMIDLFLPEHMVESPRPGSQ